MRLSGLAALFSGAALLVHILAGYSLRIALLGTGTIALAAALFRWARATAQERLVMQRMAPTAALIGLTATVVYDLVKYLLSQFDPSPYNPFEAVRIFGELLAGSNRPVVVIYATGTAFHLLNGTLFAIAFCFLFGERGALAGIAWGLFLEFFQVWLYPGWLSIALYSEFLHISLLGHVCYGLVIGLWCRTAWIKFGSPG